MGYAEGHSCKAEEPEEQSSQVFVHDSWWKPYVNGATETLAPSIINPMQSLLVWMTRAWYSPTGVCITQLCTYSEEDLTVLDNCDGSDKQSLSLSLPTAVKLTLTSLPGMERNHLSACKMMSRFWLWVPKLSLKTWKLEVKTYTDAGVKLYIIQVQFLWGGESRKMHHVCEGTLKHI